MMKLVCKMCGAVFFRNEAAPSSKCEKCGGELKLVAKSRDLEPEPAREKKK